MKRPDGRAEGVAPNAVSDGPTGSGSDPSDSAAAGPSRPGPGPGNESWFRAVFEHSRDAIGLFRCGTHLLVNPAYARMFGFQKAEEVLPYKVQDLFAPTRRKKDRDFLQLWISGKDTHLTHQMKGLRQDGSVVDLEIRLSPHGEGPDRLLIATLRDVSSRRLVEQALLDSERRFRELATAMMNGYVRIDQAGRIVECNQAFREMTGFSEGELHSFPFSTLTRDKLVPRAEPRGDAPVAGSPELVETEFQRKDGTFFPVEVKVLPVHGEPGASEGLWIVVRDITQRRQVEAERLQLEARVLHSLKMESLGMLAGGIAHDFNNLLLVVLGNLDLMGRHLDPDSPARWNLVEVEKAARSATDLCKQMLAYAGKGAFQLKPVSLAGLITDVTFLIEVSLPRKVELRVTLAPDLPPFDGDAPQIRQVIRNLVNNAAEAIGQGPGVITIATGVRDCTRKFLAGTWLDDKLPAGRYVFLEVRDTGCGLDEDARSRIFDPFFSTKVTRKGLGLSGVLGIVRCHRGAVQVLSKPGHGSTFRLLFPVSPPAQAAEAPASPPGPWRGSGRILLVDDQEAILDLGTSMLSDLGFEVLTAQDGERAIQVADAEQGNLVAVLLDLTMPRLDGVQTFHRIREKWPNIPVIMVSGYSEQELTDRMVGEGLAGFLQKPFHLEDLAEKLKTVLVPRE